jgi:parallel beta-helix repeat protein
MKTNPNQPIKLLAALLALAGLANTGRAVDFHVATAQDLQNALTSSAADGADDNIYLAAGYYTGNFNFNSAENYSLTIQGEPGTTNTQITLDGAGTGRDMNLANTGAGNFTVRGVTFLRNCGSKGIGSLRLAGDTGSALLVDTCRFLSPSNPGATGIGLEISSGQNLTLTNCLAIGNANNGNGTGIQIAGISGNVICGGCQVSSNSAYGVYNNSSGSANFFSGNNFTGNSYDGLDLYWTGPISVLNNNFINNSSGGYALEALGGNSVVAGNVFSGGGTCAAYGNPAVLSNNVFTATAGCHYMLGAAVVTGNNFSHNSMSGLFCQGNALITANAFSDNSASGTFVVLNGGTISSNSFTGNYLNSGGNGGNNGGIVQCSGSAAVVGNRFVGNTTTGNGGGVWFNFGSGTALVSGNVFEQNSAGQAGGAIFASGPAITLLDNLVVNNQGGGIYVNPTANLTMINNTVTGNTTTGNGGGLSVAVGGTSEILNAYNNIIWGNSASGNGSDVYLAGTGSKKSFINNDVDSMYGVWDITANLVDVAPNFFDPVNGDFHLQSASACLNAGTNGAPSLPLTDLDGNNRTNSLGQVDLGCYEFNNTTFHPADVNNAGVITTTEYLNYGNAWLNSQSWPTGPNPILDDYVTRAGFLLNQGGAYHNTGAGVPLNWVPGAH